MILLRETSSGSSAPMFLYPSSSARILRSFSDMSDAAGIAIACATRYGRPVCRFAILQPNEVAILHTYIFGKDTILSC
jgi:hypothetical protein